MNHCHTIVLFGVLTALLVGIGTALAPQHLSVFAVFALLPATANLFIVHPFGALDTLSSWLSTHPPIEERVRRLHAMRGSRSSRARGKAPALHYRNAGGWP